MKPQLYLQQAYATARHSLAERHPELAPEYPADCPDLECEHTGGGCYALVAYVGGNNFRHIMFTGADGAELPEQGEPVLVGFYDEDAYPICGGDVAGESYDVIHIW